MFDIGGRKVGGDHFALIAGPCTVETRDQMLDTADASRRPARRCSAAAPTSRARARTPSRASVKRACGCSPRPRSEPGCRSSPSCMDVRDIEAVAEVADVIQIGARNMQNYTLLSEIGRTGMPGAAQARPVSHARGAADGRGVHPQGGQRARHALRARHPHVRDGLPLHARPDGDPGAQGAHAPADDRRPAPRRRAAASSSSRSSLAAAAAGADGIIVEVHPQPDEAICDGPQQLRGAEFADYAAKVEQAAAIAGKSRSAPRV